MQEYKRIDITKDEIIPTAKRMRENGIPLTMIHGHIDEKSRPVVSYEYEIGKGIESYTVEGESVVPSIVDIYDLGAEWAEREIMELMDIVFEGLDTSKRLFLPENMISGQGHIIVTPMDKLIDENHNKKEEK